MTYKGLEYQDDIIIFTDRWEALNYNGEKKVLLDGDLRFYQNSSIKSLGNIVAVNGFVDLLRSRVVSTGKLEWVGEWADFRSEEDIVFDNFIHIEKNLYIYKDSEYNLEKVNVNGSIYSL